MIINNQNISQSPIAHFSPVEDSSPHPRTPSTKITFISSLTQTVFFGILSLAAILISSSTFRRSMKKRTLIAIKAAHQVLASDIPTQKTTSIIETPKKKTLFTKIYENKYNILIGIALAVHIVFLSKELYLIVQDVKNFSHEIAEKIFPTAPPQKWSKKWASVQLKGIWNGFRPAYESFDETLLGIPNHIIAHGVVKGIPNAISNIFSRAFWQPLILQGWKCSKPAFSYIGWLFKKK